MEIAPWKWKRAAEERQRVVVNDGGRVIQDTIHALAISVYQKRKVSQESIDVFMARLSRAVAAEPRMFDNQLHQTAGSLKFVRKDFVNDFSSFTWFPYEYKVRGADKEFFSDDISVGATGVRVTRNSMDQWQTSLPLRVSQHALARMYDRDIGMPQPVAYLNSHMAKILPLAIGACAWKAAGLSKTHCVILPLDHHVAVANLHHEDTQTPASTLHEIRYHRKNLFMCFPLDALSDVFSRGVYARISTTISERMLVNNQHKLRDAMLALYYRHQHQLDLLTCCVKTPFFLEHAEVDLTAFFEDLSHLEQQSMWSRALNQQTVDKHMSHPPIPDAVRIDCPPTDSMKILRSSVSKQLDLTLPFK